VGRRIGTRGGKGRGGGIVIVAGFVIIVLADELALFADEIECRRIRSQTGVEERPTAHDIVVIVATAVVARSLAK
jgi:hypothetical protein